MSAGTALYVYLAVPAAANLSTPVKCSFILDSIPEAGADFSMNSPPEVNQYNVLAYAKTDIPDGSHILNMDVGDTPVVFDYAYYTCVKSCFLLCFHCQGGTQD
jgi:hypothetical protein